MHTDTALSEDYNLLLIPLLAIIIRLIIFIKIPSSYEDAYITFRYAENLAAGNGFVYNLGERILGTTTPFFALILAIFKFLGIPCKISSLIVNLISEGITAFIVYSLIKIFFRTKIAAIPALLFVFSPSNISWAISGMETAFFASVIAISFYNLIRRRYFMAMTFAFFSAIIRIDGLSVVAVVSLFILINEYPPKPKIFFLPLTIFLIWELFLFAYFHTLIPTTLRAKLILYAGHHSSNITTLTQIFGKYFLKGHYLSSLITTAFLVGVIIVFKRKILYGSLAAWFFVYYGVLVIANTGMHGWYYIPPLFAFIIISGITIVSLYEYMVEYKQINRRILQVAMISGLLIFSTLMLYPKLTQLKSELRLSKSLISIGKYINENTSRGASVYLEPIGTIGYYADRYIYDDAGLISPQFQDLNRLEQNLQNRSKKILIANPDYLVLRIKYYNEFLSLPELYNKFEEIKRIDFNEPGKQWRGMIIFKNTG